MMYSFIVSVSFLNPS